MSMAFSISNCICENSYLQSPAWTSVSKTCRVLNFFTGAKTFVYFFMKNSIFLSIQNCMAFRKYNLSCLKLLFFLRLLARNKDQFKILKILDKVAVRE